MISGKLTAMLRSSGGLDMSRIPKFDIGIRDLNGCDLT